MTIVPLISDRSVDVAILGAGTAGLNARRAVKAAGKRALLIDPGPFGTTCARVGCMPSKLLIAAADTAHHARHAARFGVHTEGVRVDGPAVLRRVQAERDRFVGFVLDVIEEARREDELLVGWGAVSGPKEVLVQGADSSQTRVHYESLVIATGSSPFVPPPFRGLGKHVGLTNEDVFELAKLPESLLVVGLGVIGLELGQAFARLGARTTLLGVGGAVGPLTDPELVAEAGRVLSDELDLHTDYVLKQVDEVVGGAAVHFVDSKGVERRETFECVLFAAGRRSHLARLGLDALGLGPRADGRYPIDPDTLQLGDAPIFVAGDANELHPLLHEAADDGTIAGSNAARFPEVRAPARRTPLGIVFSDPQIAVVGGGFGVLGTCAAVAGEASFSNQGRARVQGMNAGKLRVYADKHSGRLLGAELIGPRAEHLAHLLAWAVQQGLTVERALEMPFYHPVVEEGLRTALRDLAAALGRGQPIKCAVSELGPGA